MKVCGPELVQILRGWVLGRQVVLICCGEPHEKVIDLTRQNGVLSVRPEDDKDEEAVKYRRLNYDVTKVQPFSEAPQRSKYTQNPAASSRVLFSRHFVISALLELFGLWLLLS